MFVQKLEIEPIEKFTEGATVKVDGVELHNVLGYDIRHMAGEIAHAVISFNIRAGYEHDAIIEVADMESIATCMNKEQFEEFCKIWKEIHEV